jgi:hypothetical protein
VTVTASASDDVGVTSVQLRLDGADLGPEDTSAPYSAAWDTTGVANGSHTLTAVARDAAGNATTSDPVTVTVSNVEVEAPAGLVGAWGFEEASGGSATDSSGSGNDGAISGATRTGQGRHGAALSFDGLDDLVTVADQASLDLQSAMTLEAWVFPTTSTGWRSVMIKERPGGLVYALYGNTNANRPSGHLFTSSGAAVAHGTQRLPVNTWTHLAATWDGTTLRLYVNGTQASSLAAGGTLSNSAGALRIGGNSAASQWFTGRLDEMRVYNRALSANEIQTDMNTPVAP